MCEVVLSVESTQNGHGWISLRMGDHIALCYSLINLHDLQFWVEAKEAIYKNIRLVTVLEPIHGYLTGLLSDS